MTKKDYELIADTLSRSDRTNWRGYIDLCEDFAIALSATNPLFDKQRFLKACGVTL